MNLAGHCLDEQIVQFVEGCHVQQVHHYGFARGADCGCRHCHARLGAVAVRLPRAAGADAALRRSRRSPIHAATDEAADEAPLPPRLHRQIVDYSTHEAPGTIVVDTPHTYLYFVLGGGKAMRYGIGVGREGFTWSGVKTVARKAEWPDWYPPTEMISVSPTCRA